MNKGRFLGIVMLILFTIININIVDVFADDDGYYIKNFNVDVTINDKREYLVTETIDVYFNEYRHGIIREIPKSNTLEGYDITNVNVEGAPSSIENSSDIEIKIGDADEEIRGEKQYIISYTIKSYDDEKSDGDYVRINLLGGNWDTKIENFKATVNYPDTSNLQKINVFSGPYGSTENEYTEYKTDENTITVQSKKEIKSKCAVTLSAVFNEGTFKNAIKKEYPYEIVNQDVNIEITEDKAYIITRKYEVDVKDNSNDTKNSILFWYDNYDEITDIYCSDKNITVDEYSKKIILPSQSGNYKFKLSCKVWENLKNDVKIFINDYNVSGKNKNLNVNISSPYNLNKSVIVYNNIDNGYINEKYNVEINDNNLIFHNLEDVMFGDSIEIIPNIDNTLFKRELPEMTKSIPYSSGIVLIIAIILYLLMREKPLKCDEIEVSPPDNLNNIEVAYIHNNKITDNDIWNILFYWASQGHVSVKLIKNNKFKVTMLSKLDDDHKKYEVELFDFIFSNAKNNTITSTDLKGTTKKINNKTRRGVKRYFRGRKSIKSLTAYCLSFVVFLGALIPLNLFFNAYGEYVYNDPERMTLLVYLGIAELILLYKFEYDGNEKSFREEGKKKKILLTIITSIIFIVIFYFESLGSLLPLGYDMIFILASVISVVLAARIPKRSTYGREVTEMIINFKRFIKNGERKDIKALLEENPEYFYYILPYANSLKVSDLWAEKFKGLKKSKGKGKNKNIDSYTYYDDYSLMSRSLDESLGKSPKTNYGSSSSSSNSSYSGGDYSDGGSGGGGGSSW